MDLWLFLFVPIGIVLVCLGIYGLHRLFLSLEDKGWIDYVRKSPVGSSVGSLVELQKALEPKVQHGVEAKLSKPVQAEKWVPGEGKETQSRVPEKPGVNS